MKKIISFVLLFILMFCSLTIDSFAKTDYEIDMPSEFKEYSDDLYMDDENHIIGILIKDGNYKDEDEIYTNDMLDEVITLMYQEISYFGNVAIVEKDISRFTENEYECFEFVFEINSKYASQPGSTVTTDTFYQKYYIVVSGDEMLILYVQSFDYDYFESKELTKIIDSLTVEDLVGRKQEKELIWKRIFIVGGILIGIIFLIGIYNKIKEKSFYNKSQVILQQQELAQRRAERELQKSLEIEKKQQTNINRNNEGFSTVNPNLVNGSFDIRDNDKEKDDTPSFTTTRTKELNIGKRKCPNCGKENEEYWAFCNYCGHKLDKND